jgi:hypothetical protein
LTQTDYLRTRILLPAPPLRYTRQASDAASHWHASGADRADEALVVFRGLVGVGEREAAERAIEASARAAVGGDRRGVSRAGVRLGEDLAAQTAAYSWSAAPRSSSGSTLAL